MSSEFKNKAVEDNSVLPCEQNSDEQPYNSLVEEDENVENPECIVQFYRSNPQIEDKYGKADKEYDGSFGFDRFNKKVCAEYDISKYEKINHLVPKEATVKDIHLYLCAYLSILPGKKISIYARAEEFLDKNNRDTEVEIEFKCKLSNQLVIKQDRKKLMIGNNNSICKIEIECKGTFKDSAIEAYQKKKNDDGKEVNVPVGKLIVAGNDSRYSTIIRPVIVRLKNNNRFLNPTTNAEQNVIDTYKKMIPYLQNHSFNQAYIKCEEDTAFPQSPADIQNSQNHYLEIDINSISEKYRNLIVHDSGNVYYLMGVKRDFFEFIAMKYTGKDAAAIKNQAIADTQIKEKITKLMQELRKGFKFDKSRHKSGEDCYKAKLLTNAFHRESSFLGLGKKRPVIEAHREYREARQEYLKILANKGVSPGYSTSLMDDAYKNGYVHVYFFPDIARADSEGNIRLSVDDIRNGTYVPGVADTGKGTAYIMNVCIDPIDTATGASNTEEAHKLQEAYTAHEIGHALGLSHPFEEKDSEPYQTAEGKDNDSKTQRLDQLHGLEQNYEQYKNGEIGEDGKEISGLTSSDSVRDVYYRLLGYLNQADKASQFFLIDRLTQEKNKSALLMENPDDVKNGWEPVDSPSYFDPKVKSKTQYWSPNLITPENTKRDWNREFDTLLVFGNDEPLFKYFELLLYMELTQTSLQQTKKIMPTGTSKTIMTEEEIQDEICRLELDIEKLEKEQHLLFNEELKTYIGQSKTEENFMDYTFAGENKNDNFVHKSFNHFQWEKMWETSTGKFLNKQQ